MINIKIVTASFESLNTKTYEGYTPISVVGKVYGSFRNSERVKKMVGFSIFRMYSNQRAGDFLACNLLYRKKLEKKGAERLLRNIRQFCEEENTTKAVLLGYGEGDEFCYRHIFADFLRANGIPVKAETSIDQNVQQEYWSDDIYKLRGHFNLKDKFVGETLEAMEWTFASTMQNNPHFYSIREKFGNNSTFLQIVSHIRYFGDLVEFEDIIYRVWTYRNHSYWSIPSDLLNEDVDLINRKINL
ncbi:hypothetical protein [Epilithonimonas zeae]|uniref:hypothetical protein n=1 Tax=Epilithonimonas zeae TaxID=1416779 RepID=UPI00200C7A6A|nr:hypothetical protein [Epilithonimonas zeae]UQB67583.1 hypothetical protein KI430_11080 [Epilithonimonas zeae]